MKLTVFFLLMTLVLVYAIDSSTHSAMTKETKIKWNEEVFVRYETRNCPVYSPAFRER